MNKLYLIATGALLSGIITIQAQEWKPQQWPVLKKYDKEHLYQIALPLGGIGTGTVSLGGRNLHGSIMQASIIKTISLPKLLVHGLQRQSLKQTATGQPTTSQNLRTHTKYLAIASICRTVKRFFHLER